MMWFLLGLMAFAEDDRTECEKAVGTPRFRSGVRVTVMPLCSEAVAPDPETYEKSACKSSRMYLYFPDPYVPDQMKIEFIETRRVLPRNDDGQPQDRNQITAHNSWLEAGQTVGIWLASGRSFTLVLQERAQARPYFSVAGDYVAGLERLQWTVRVALTVEQARAMGAEGLKSWSFAAPGISGHHAVKRAKKLDKAAACLFQ